MIRFFFSLLLCSLFVSGTFAQWVQPTGTIMRAVSIPVIDGVNTDDAEYLNAEVYNIDRPFVQDAPLVPTLGEEGETNWRAVYSQETGKAGIYILVTVVDDIYLPQYVNGSGDHYQFDKIELYFDCNYEKVDGVGGQDKTTTGHYQVAPAYAAAKVDGIVTTNAVGTDGVKYTFMLDDPNITAEYFIPFSKLKDKEGAAMDMYGTLGFDVTVVDRDDAVTEDHRKRMVWSNDASSGNQGADESWNNMDEAGLVDLEQASCCNFVEYISLEPGVITENNGTLQMAATILPENADFKDLIYELTNGTGSASITSTGLITAKTDGTVSVVAKPTDGSYVESDPVEITISNQVVTLKDLNLIPNGDFNVVNAGGQAVHWTGGWTDASPAHQVVDGVSVHNPLATTDVWRYQFNNTSFITEPNVDYAFNFVAWSEVHGRPFLVAFEDTEANGLNKYGGSPDVTANNGRSEWNIPITAEPVKYELSVNFDQKIPGTVDKVSFMLGTAEGKTYIDKVELIKTSDLALITEYVPVQSIEVVAYGGQMSAIVTPDSATYKNVKWSIIPGTGDASIDKTGMINSISPGTIMVVATATDDSEVFGTLMFEIAFVCAPGSGNRFSVCDGISENEFNSLLVYPSVAANSINIETNIPNASATIYNSFGSKVGEVVAGMDIDVSYLAKGVYFVKAGNAVARFIKK